MGIWLRRIESRGLFAKRKIEEPLASILERCAGFCGLRRLGLRRRLGAWGFQIGFEAYGLDFHVK